MEGAIIQSATAVLIWIIGGLVAALVMAYVTQGAP